MSDTSVTLKQSCSRCRRTVAVEVGSAEEAFEVKKTDAAKTDGAKRLEDFVVDLIAEGALPDLFTVQAVDGDVRFTSHVRLCDGTDAKRSCTKTVDALVKGTGVIPTRAPRGSKKAAQEVPATQVAEVTEVDPSELEPSDE